MCAFATAEDYEARYGTVPEAARVAVLLEDAGVFLESELARSGKRVDGGDALQAAALKRISCRLAHDMLSASSDMSGVSQESMTAGPFSNSWTFVNPTGAFKLLPSERRTLGVGGVRAGSVAPLVHHA